MNWKLLLLAAALVGAVVAGILLRTEHDETLELTILHTNDLHAHYDSFEPWGEALQGGVARLKTLVDDLRGDCDEVLFLDAGDQFQGTLYFTVGGAEVVADVMNELGYDAMCAGNHEFDSGPAELAALIDEADFPILGANIDASADPDLSGKIFPYALYGIEGVTVAVIGLTTEHTATASSPGENVKFLDVIATAQSTVADLESYGGNVIIALTHLGTGRDLELARAVSGIDVIVGGHSHTLLGPGDDTAGPYPVAEMSPAGEPVLVVTAHEWGKRLGRLNVSFSAEGVVESYAGEPIFVGERIPENRKMVKLLDAYRPAIEALMAQIVGSTGVDLNGAREDIRVRETNLGNLICDAMLWKAQGLGATIAIQNGGGIRASIPAGDIAMGQVLEVLPYGNQLTVLTVMGEELVAALENGVGGVEEGAGRFPHVGGMRYAFDPSSEPGSRIVSAEVWDAGSESYVELDPTATYTLATNNYLADGGDGYNYSGASDRYDTGWLLSDTLAEFLAEFDSVLPAVEGRITEVE